MGLWVERVYIYFIIVNLMSVAVDCSTYFV